MHAYLLKIISARMANPAEGGALLKGRSKRADAFLSAVREARVRLGRPGPEKNPSRMIRAEQFGAMKSKEVPQGKKDVESSNVADLRDLAPLLILLRESGVSPEGARRFLDSLTAQAPEARMPVAELVERIRSFILSERGAEGRLLLDPAARLRVESGLTKLGFSPKEADRALSLAHSGSGEVDVERFVRTTLVERGEREDKLFRQGDREAGLPRQDKPDGGPRASLAGAKAAAVSDHVVSRGPARGTPPAVPDAKAGPAVGDAVSLAGTASRAENIKIPIWTPPSGNVPSLAGDGGQEPGKKGDPGKGSGFKAQAAGKPASFAVPSDRADGAVRAAHLDNAKGWTGSEKAPMAAKEIPFEQGAGALHSKAASAAGSGPQQTWAKPTGAPASPSPAENIVPAHVIGQVSRQLSRAALRGDQTIRLHLNPPQLGALKVRLEGSQDKLRIEMVTDRHPVKEILLSSLSELKQTLGEQGFRVDKMEVQVEDPSGRNPSLLDQEHRNPSGSGARSREEASFFPAGDGGTETMQPLHAQEGRLLDVVA